MELDSLMYSQGSIDGKMSRKILDVFLQHNGSSFVFRIGLVNIKVWLRDRVLVSCLSGSIELRK